MSRPGSRFTVDHHGGSGGEPTPEECPPTFVENENNSVESILSELSSIYNETNVVQDLIGALIPNFKSQASALDSLIAILDYRFDEDNEVSDSFDPKPTFQSLVDVETLLSSLNPTFQENCSSDDTLQSLDFSSEEAVSINTRFNRLSRIGFIKGEFFDIADLNEFFCDAIVDDDGNLELPGDPTPVRNNDALGNGETFYVAQFDTAKIDGLRLREIYFFFYADNGDALLDTKVDWVITSDSTKYIDPGVDSPGDPGPAWGDGNRTIVTGETTIPANTSQGSFIAFEDNDSSILNGLKWVYVYLGHRDLFVTGTTVIPSVYSSDSSISSIRPSCDFYFTLN